LSLEIDLPPRLRARKKRAFAAGRIKLLRRTGEAGLLVGEQSRWRECSEGMILGHFPRSASLSKKRPEVSLCGIAISQITRIEGSGQSRLRMAVIAPGEAEIEYQCFFAIGPFEAARY
jgi:hypothetical protein